MVEKIVDQRAAGSSFQEMVEAVAKAGRELGPCYMLDPDIDAVSAVIDDLKNPLPEFKPEPLKPLSPEIME